MNGSPELLEFYLVEATEYVDALDRLVAGAQTAPDINALIATARALRGTSTMAKVSPIAELSQMVEQVAQRCRDGDERWTSDLFGALRSTIDDLRMLIRDVRVWGDREMARADACRERLRPFTSEQPVRTPTPTAGSTTPVFLALQAAAIAAELDAFVDNPQNRRSLDDALSRSRTMRGIAGIADFPPLGDVAEVIDRVGRQLMPDAALSPDEHELFRSAAGLLRRAAEQLRTAGRHEPDQSDLARFARAVGALESPGRAPEAPIVRIDQLFHVDEGPHIIRRAPAPPTTPAARLARELVARSEHLRRLIGDARAAADIVARDRATRDLVRALSELGSLAESFGSAPLADFARSRATPAVLARGETLGQLERATESLTAPFESLMELDQRVIALMRPPAPVPETPVRPSPAVPAPRTPAAEPFARRTPTAAQPVRAGRTPTGAELQQLLATSLEGLRPLEAAVVTASLDAPGEIVPIDTLLYRGRAALERALELRDGIRERGEADPDALEEIFDLLDLARQD
jgi:chemotaxis protein histidine kinase CheA